MHVCLKSNSVLQKNGKEYTQGNIKEDFGSAFLLSYFASSCHHVHSTNQFHTKCSPVCSLSLRC